MPHFIDKIQLTVSSGRGGQGAVAFRREKYIPKGGPSGGDGGDGGDIIFHVNRQLSSLAHLYPHKEISAGAGDHGSNLKRSGKKGISSIIQIPQGTILKDNNDLLIKDFNRSEETFLFLDGGKGGKGNVHFATASNQAPRYAQAGLDGKAVDVILEIKLIADIGLIGLPNAGKSTFLACFTNANPKIADYPFTTLTPALGIYQLDVENTLLIADIPGIIQDAHLGKGLGLHFLRHLERTFFLFYLIDSFNDDPHKNFQKLRHEIKSHSDALYQKPFAIGLSKIDLLTDEALQKKISLFPKALQEDIICFSSLAKLGLEKINKIAYSILALKKAQSLI